MPDDTTNFGVGGETSGQVLARWLARSEYRALNVWWAGRNDITDPSAPIDNAAAAVAARKPGEKLLLISVHNFNSSIEPSGSANYIKIAAINAGLAGLADGTNVFYIDTRSECVYEYVLDNINDQVDFAEEAPARSLTAEDGLHLNSIGSYVAARLIFWQCYLLWTAADPPANLVVNGDFASDVSGWTASNDAVLTWSAGGMIVAGTGGFKNAGQQVAVSGQNGKRFLLAWDMVDLAADTFSVKVRPFLGFGTNFPAAEGFENPINYGSSVGFESPYSLIARRRAHRMMLPFTANNDAFAFMFEGNNTAGSTWKVDNVILHEID
jgi:hypothetical protein